MASELWAGVARVTITPPVGSTWQGGYAARKRPVQGIHDDLGATALLLANSPDDVAGRVALVAADLLNLSAEQVVAVRRLVAEQGSVRPERVMLLCSHTHGGPALLSRAHPPVNAVYVEALLQQLAGVVYAAAQSWRPVRLGLGFGNAGFNVNRRLRLADGRMVMRPNPDGAIDRTVTVVRLDPARVDGAAPGQGPLALLYRYACHPTSVGAENDLITADYPGAARRYIEQVYRAGPSNTFGMFLPGCFANLRPNLRGPDGGFRSATWPELDALGRQLAGAAIAAAEAAGDPIATTPPPDLGGPVDAAATWIDLPLEPNDAGRPGWPAEVQVLRLGGLYLVGLPGEVFLEIGWRTQREVAAAVGVPPERVLVQGYSNGTIAYVPSAAAIPEGGYEVDAWKNGPRPAGFTADVERILAETAATLAAQVAGAPSE
jgi:neutral ceramidase